LFSAMQLKMTIKNPFLNAQLQSKPLTICSLIFLANGLHPVIPAFKSETDMNTFTSKALPLMKTYTSWDGVSNLNHGNNKNDVTTESTVVFMETFTDDAVGAADASASGAADASASGAAEASASGAADEGAASGPADAGASGDAAAASGPAEEPPAPAASPPSEGEFIEVTATAGPLEADAIAHLNGETYEVVVTGKFFEDKFFDRTAQKFLYYRTVMTMAAEEIIEMYMPNINVLSKGKKARAAPLTGGDAVECTPPTIDHDVAVQVVADLVTYCYMEQRAVYNKEATDTSLTDQKDKLFSTEWVNAKPVQADRLAYLKALSDGLAGLADKNDKSFANRCVPQIEAVLNPATLAKREDFVAKAGEYCTPPAATSSLRFKKTSTLLRED
jgi:hypothetical protein